MERVAEGAQPRIQAAPRKYVQRDRLALAQYVETEVAEPVDDIAEEEAIRHPLRACRAPAKIVL
eukprot:4899359-Prymnesium_polylepis.1